MMKLTTGNRKQERQKKSKQEKCRRKQDENYGKANENLGKLVLQFGVVENVRKSSVSLENLLNFYRLLENFNIY